MYKHFFKRFFDFWISLIVLIIISPILLVVTIWLHFANKGAGVNRTDMYVAYINSGDNLVALCQ